MIKHLLTIAVLFAALPFTATAADEEVDLKRQLLTASAAHIDPLFGYYHNRSAESIAWELEVNNYNAAYCFAVTPAACSHELTEALHAHNISAVLITFPSWIYLSDEDMDRYLPEEWRSWLMEFTNPEAKKWKFISYVYPEYNEWYAGYLANLVKEYGYDGVTMLEMMYPVYDGLKHNPPEFGDISEGFRQAFERKTGYAVLPDFTNPDSPDYYKNNPVLMDEFLKFRTESITNFYGYIMDRVREVNPGVIIISWALGVSEPDGEDKISFYNGSDTYSLFERVQPDIHIIQTHWPDWTNPQLPPDYVKRYQPFIDAARAACPGVKVGVQSDYGSLPQMRRNLEWVKAHRSACDEVLDNFLVYEFSLRDEVYSEAPVLKTAYIDGSGAVLTLVFDQRIAADSGDLMTGRIIKGAADYTVLSGVVDGNLLKLTLTALPSSGESLTVPVGGIADDPSVRLPLSQHEPKPNGRVNRIPADQNTTLTLP